MTQWEELDEINRQMIDQLWEDQKADRELSNQQFADFAFCSGMIRREMIMDRIAAGYRSQMLRKN